MKEQLTDHEVHDAAVSRRRALGLAAVAGGLATFGVLGSATSASAATTYTSVNSVAAMAALPLTSPMLPVLVLGYSTPGDGGGGVFYWDTTAGAADGGFIIASTTSTAGKWHRVSDNDEWVNPLWFGCKCDGTTDDTAAFQAALNSAVSRGRELVLPEGRLRLTSAVSTATGSGSRRLSIRGLGLETSTILLDGTSSLTFHMGDVGEYVAGRLLARDFSIKCRDGATISTAMKVVFARTSGTTPQTSLIENIEIAGDGTAASGPVVGLQVTDAQALRISGLRVSGRRATPFPAGSTGLLLDGSSIPVEMYISESKFYSVLTGIKISGHLEGVNIDHCAVVSADYGIVASTSTSEPASWLNVSHCHLNTKAGGIVVSNWLNVSLTGNLIYGDPGGSGYQGINIVAGFSASIGSFSNIVDNIMTFVGDAAYSKYGIVLGGGPAEDSVLISNNLLGFFDRGIWLVSDCERTAVAGTNVFRSCASNVVDNGTNNVVQPALESWS